jgi:hypothetical protein
MGYLSSMRLSHEYVERPVGEVIVFGLVLGGKRRAVGRFFGKGCLGFGFIFRVAQVYEYWFKVYLVAL